ncbi:MAG TPA: ABC transporter ATP-binding protein [Longimicrobiales bacterium]|nr:ABC transporter ATP-binding protein [Longimicrobiales bacterium]
MDGLPTRVTAPVWGIETIGLSRTYGRTTAVDDLDLTVPEGAIYLLAGQNGAGKTTVMRLLLGLMRPDGGESRVAGVRSGPRGDVRAHIGYVPETHELPYGRMRVGHLMDHEASYRRTWNHEYAGHLVRELDIDRSRRLGALSKGEMRRVQLVVALSHRPRVLLLDEPTDGLDPLVRDTVLRLLVEHVSDTGTTVLVATHVVHEMDRLADHVGVLRGGRLLAQTTRDELRAKLRRYRFQAPADWRPPEVPVAHRNGGAGEYEWTVWGDESSVVAHLTQSGASVTAASPLELNDAVLTLLRMENR